MRKFFVLILFLSFSFNCVFADEWDDYIKIDNEAKNQQKTVTEAEFENVMKRFEKKKKDKNKPKGEARLSAPDTADNLKIINEMYDTYPTILVPTDLITQDGQEIPTGFYKIMSVKKPGVVFMNFYQGNSLVAKVKSKETDNDYNQKTLNYAQIISESARTVKFIYGDIDCNLETSLHIKNPQ